MSSAAKQVAVEGLPRGAPVEGRARAEGDQGGQPVAPRPRPRRGAWRALARAADEEAGGRHLAGGARPLGAGGARRAVQARPARRGGAARGAQPAAQLPRRPDRALHRHDHRGHGERRAGGRTGGRRRRRRRGRRAAQGGQGAQQTPRMRAGVDRGRPR
eukprot:1584358-Prymnesium_polylepis.2